MSNLKNPTPFYLYKNPVIPDSKPLGKVAYSEDDIAVEGDQKELRMKRRSLDEGLSNDLLSPTTHRLSILFHRQRSQKGIEKPVKRSTDSTAFIKLITLFMKMKIFKNLLQVSFHFQASRGCESGTRRDGGSKVRKEEHHSVFLCVSLAPNHRKRFENPKAQVSNRHPPNS